ncbi:MAG: hypothetical protein HY959_12240 [Ignavibacteriae bacterium]|nr:hypothetical protein [Ignavibacteriota bacterium]
MERIKLFEILKSFSIREFKEFGKYIHSPFFNESKRLEKFYNILNSGFPEFDSSKENKEHLFGLLFKKEKYSDKKFRDICSQMGKHAEDFLAQLELKKEPLELNRFSLHQISKRHLDKHFESKCREIEGLLEKISFKDNYFFFHEYLLKKDIRQYYACRKPLGKRYEYYKEFGNEVEIFIRHFVLRVLKYFVVLFRHEKEISYKFVSPTIESIMNYVKLKNYDDYPVVSIFFNLLLLFLKKEGADLYFKTKEIILIHYNYLEKSDLSLVLKEMAYYTLEKIESGETDFNKEYFIWINKIIERGLYIDEEEGGMSTHFFINVVNAGLYMEEIEWTKKFIQKYSDFLTPLNKENTILLCYAKLNFEKCNFSESKELAEDINAKDFYFHIFKKVMLIKAHFELKNFDNVFVISKTLSQILDYDKAIPENILQKYKSFISFTKKMTALKINYDELGFKRLKNRMNTEIYIESRDWIRKKLAEISLD